MNRFQVWWWHFRMAWLGNKEFEDKGGGTIPCRNCGRLFKSYPHFASGFDAYDSLCDDCEFLTIDPLHIKKAVEQILTDYNSKVKSWDDVKAYLLSEGFKIRYAPNRCAWLKCELKGDEPTLKEIIRTYRKGSWQKGVAMAYMGDYAFKPTDRLCANCFSIIKKMEEKKSN